MFAGSDTSDGFVSSGLISRGGSSARLETEKLGNIKEMGAMVTKLRLLRACCGSWGLSGLMGRGSDAFCRGEPPGMLAQGLQDPPGRHPIP